MGTGSSADTVAGQRMVNSWGGMGVAVGVGVGVGVGVSVGVGEGVGVGVAVAVAVGLAVKMGVRVGRLPSRSGAQAVSATMVTAIGMAVRRDTRKSFH